MQDDNFRALSRRQWLKQMAALSALTSVSPQGVLRAQAPANARRLDLHHHFGSPRWIKRVVEIKRQGWQQFDTYTPAKAIAAMDAATAAGGTLHVVHQGDVVNVPAGVPSQDNWKLECG